MNLIHTAAQVANSSSASSTSITLVGAIIIGLIVLAICYLNRNNI